MRTNSFFFICTLLLTAACSFTGDFSGIFTIDGVRKIHGLHAPWDVLNDSTVFHCFTDEDDFYFLYEVQDTTIVLSDNFTGESDVEKEDRVEIFFSAEKDMDIYYCAEIDPLGRLLDYSSSYYRNMDYGWDFKTMKLWSSLTSSGYVVGGSVSKRELENLGIDVSRSFYMGIFRADFKPDTPENWYSYIETDDNFPDFHKPDVLFKARMK